jgi:hypothetical protein
MNLDRHFVIHAGRDAYPLAPKVHALPLVNAWQGLADYTQPVGLGIPA